VFVEAFRLQNIRYPISATAKKKKKKKYQPARSLFGMSRWPPILFSLLLSFS
jgi:hypothetical protein